MNKTKPLKDIDAIEKYRDELKNMRYDIRYKYLFMFEMGLYSGLRISDLLKIRVCDILPRKRQLKVIEQKTGKIRVIEITPKIREIARKVQNIMNLKPTDFIIQGQSKNKPLHRSQAFIKLRQIGHDTGYENIGTHSLRKTYAVQLFKSSGGNLEYVQKMMNHKYSDTTLNSYILSGVEIKDVLKLLE